MFGITEARAAETSGERADIPGDTSEMPTTCEKRPLSPADCEHRSVKQPKLADTPRSASFSQIWIDDDTSREAEDNATVYSPMKTYENTTTSYVEGKTIIPRDIINALENSVDEDDKLTRNYVFDNSNKNLPNQSGKKVDKKTTVNGTQKTLFDFFETRVKDVKQNEKNSTSNNQNSTTRSKDQNTVTISGEDDAESEYVDVEEAEEEEEEEKSKDDSKLLLKELKIVLKDVRKDAAFPQNVKIVENFGKEKPAKSGRTSQARLWEVERILSKKEENNKILYLIKWKDWGSEHNTWEPRDNLTNCPEILENFEKERLRLLENFKKRANFYPTSRDVENFLMESKYRGEGVDTPFVEAKLYASLKNFFKQRYVPGNKPEMTARRHVLRQLLSEMRKEQLESLNEWESEMNSITKGKPLIKVENVIDLESAPQDFFYIDDYLPGAGVIIPEDPPIGCDCTTCEPKSKCCYSQYDSLFPYTTACRVRVPPGTPIYECNKRCNCEEDCQNRVVQRGTNTKLCVFRTSNGRGWGVKTLRAIKKGTFVTQYVGEVITNEEAEKRGRQYDAAGRTYLFDLDYNEGYDQCPYTVDAAMYGNISHFINHSCDPNLAVYAVWINCLDPNLPKLALFATRDIKQNEEITFDYMCQSSRMSEKKLSQQQNITVDDTDVEGINDSNSIVSEPRPRLEQRPETPVSDISNNKTLCKCGAATCRQYLF